MKSLPNSITTFRILLAVIAVCFLQLNKTFQLTAMILIPIVMILDLLDGVVARKTQTNTLFGSVYDIAADRFIEYLFFIFFATQSICSFWIVVIIIARGMSLDVIRSFALCRGKTAFGKTSMHQELWADFLTNSRFSRGLYNTLKTLSFFFMAWQLYADLQSIWIQALVWLTVLWAILRAIPVFIEGYKMRLINL